MNVTPLLARPPTVTTTLPLVAPAGTGTTMLVALHVVGVARAVERDRARALRRAELVPVIVTAAPTGPDAGSRQVMLGGTVTVNVTPLLARPPTVTTTFPVVAPAGTGTTMLVSLHAVGVAAVPLNVTVPGVAPKLVPAIVTAVPAGPDAGVRLVMPGADEVSETVNVWSPIVSVPVRVDADVLDATVN